MSIEFARATTDAEVEAVQRLRSHLLSMYLEMGQRTYAQHNINSATAGYLIPLVSFIPDADALRGRVLSLSERVLRTMIAEDATVAAKLLLNLSKMLCVRLARTT
jgi:hypothetical protein